MMNGMVFRPPFLVVDRGCRSDPSEEPSIAGGGASKGKMEMMEVASKDAEKSFARSYKNKKKKNNGYVLPLYTLLTIISLDYMKGKRLLIPFIYFSSEGSITFSSRSVIILLQKEKATGKMPKIIAGGPVPDLC